MSVKAGRRGLLLAAASLLVVRPAAASGPDWLRRKTVLRGDLGGRRIEMTLAPDPDAPESVQGSYFVFGEGGIIALAGEYEGETLSMEESHDGTDVSGLWTGRADARGLRGTWRDARGEAPQPFTLTILVR